MNWKVYGVAAAVVAALVVYLVLPVLFTDSTEEAMTAGSRGQVSRPKDSPAEVTMSEMREPVSGRAGDESGTSERPDIEVAIESAPTPSEAYGLESWSTIGSLTRVEVQDYVFDEIYPEDLTYDDLFGAWTAKSTAWQKRALELGQAAFDRGDFEERPIPISVDGIPISNWVGFGSSTPHAVVRRGGPVPDGFAQVTWLRYEEHPELYDARDEWNYLRRRFQALQER
ncbi:hypothetical protein [Engelhardtia mirabilis]|uniref:Uncharacterized protein n=1 Tax=Engelhardtia mirabilis TaxID=2528011 RepID=A0A518BNE0_9BACT|nr:hypothetical protein Pla133_35920 [Planctomycetes bacterium Pla133]QDV02819.1 hypothetical protein Pla86_35900 [Planctomycetes bacterium Pla86]